VDFVEYRHAGDAIIFISRDQVHYFEPGQPDGLLLHINSAYVGAALAAKESAFLFHLLDGFYRAPLIAPIGEELTEMTTLLQLLAQEYRRPPTNAGNDLMMSLLSAVLILAHRSKAKLEERRQSDDNRERGLYLEFKWHLEQDFATAHDVSHSAGLLGIGSQRLSEACRRSTGLSAKSLISERVILEAKRYLCYSDMVISEVAAHLGYDDPLYFSRAFRQVVGKSPREFRKSDPSTPLLEGRARAHRDRRVPPDRRAAARPSGASRCVAAARSGGPGLGADC
jgi:AraC-like DNA-binding protein